MAHIKLMDDPRWRHSVDFEAGHTLLVRLATHTDYKDVVDIDKYHTVYDGHDYLPYLYHYILQEHHAYPFVGVLNDVIVYFTVMHVVEGGTSTISCAARVSEQYKGLKVAHTARRMVCEIIQHNIPSLKWDRYTGVMWDSVVAAAKKPKPPFKIIQKWDFKAVSFPGEELRIFLSQQKESRTLPYTTDLLNKKRSWDILSDARICRKIFPIQQMVYLGHNWMPFKIPATRDDFTHMFTMSELYGVYDRSGALVGFGTIHAFPSVYGVEVQTWYYGSGEAEAVTSYLTSVLRDHVKHASSGKSFSLTFSSPEHIDSNVIYDFFKDCRFVEDKKAAYMCGI